MKADDFKKGNHIESGLEIKAGIFVNKAPAPGNVWNSKMSYLNVGN